MAQKQKTAQARPTFLFNFEIHVRNPVCFQRRLKPDINVGRGDKGSTLVHHHDTRRRVLGLTDQENKSSEQAAETGWGVTPRMQTIKVHPAENPQLGAQEVCEEGGGSLSHSSPVLNKPYSFCGRKAP